VFDVDDTLYDEIDYVRSGFAHVASLGQGSEVSAATLERWLLDAFESGVRGDTIDRMLASFPSVAARVTRSELIDAYRAHAPEIHLDPATYRLLDDVRDRPFRLAVLSDGPPASQRSKVIALGLDRWFDPIVLTGTLGPGYAKPATGGFEQIARAWGMPGHALVYVADNPEKDFAGPRSLGWTTIRLRHARQLRHSVEPVDDASSPDLEIHSLTELARLPDLSAFRKPSIGERICM